MSDKKVESAPVPERSARKGLIEILQVVSLLLFATAWSLREVWIPASGLAVVFFAVPFLLVQRQERERRQRRALGYKITPEVLEKLAEAGMPAAMIQLIEASMKAKIYPSRKVFLQALFKCVGQGNIKPWLGKILRNARYYGEPPKPPQVDPVLHAREA